MATLLELLMTSYQSLPLGTTTDRSSGRPLGRATHPHPARHLPSVAWCLKTSRIRATGCLEGSTRGLLPGNRLTSVCRADVMDVHYPDHSFETVASALAIRTYDEPVRGLQEMARVCKPCGTLLVLEHGHKLHPVGPVAGLPGAPARPPRRLSPGLGTS